MFCHLISFVHSSAVELTVSASNSGGAHGRHLDALLPRYRPEELELVLGCVTCIQILDVCARWRSRCTDVGSHLLLIHTYSPSPVNAAMAVTGGYQLSRKIRADFFEGPEAAVSA